MPFAESPTAGPRSARPRQNTITVTASLTVTRVLPPGNAVYDPTLKAPKCATVGALCDTGGLVDGRASLGPETNAPNTIGGSRADGTAGSYHSDESLDRLKIATVDGTNLAPGKAVTIEATAWVWSGYGSDHLELYLTTDASAASPAWTLLPSITPTASGAQVLSFGTTLPATGASLWAIRGNFRYSGSAAVTTTWSKVSGPGTVTFGNASAKVTTASFSAAGSYTLRLTASDSALSASDDLVVTVNSGSSPCAGICTNPTVFTINGSYQSGNIGTGAKCYETTSTIHGANCGNFVSPRTLKVNGTTETCNYQNWTSVPAKVNGGYCIQVSSGNYAWAYFAAW